MNSAQAIPLCALLLIGCGAPQTPRQRPSDDLLVPPPSAAVDFTLPQLSGGSVTLSDLRGKPVLLFLFTTWDMRCQAEAPLFNQLHEKHGPRGLEVLGVALAPVGPTGLPLVRTYVQVTKMTFDVLLSQPDGLELVGAVGQTRQVPRVVLLDRRGKVVLEMAGQTDFPLLRRRILRLLSSGPAPL